MISLLAPITTFMYLYPELIIQVLLGSQWTEVAPLLRPFSLFFLTFCLFALISDAIIAQGRVKMLFWFDVISTIAIVAILVQWGTSSLETMAWLRGWLAVATTVVLLILLDRQTAFGIAQLTWLCVPALVASATAGWAVWQLPVSLDFALTELLVRGTFFVALASVITIAFGWLILRRQEEWQQLSSIVRPLLNKLRS